jgi:hypothetical protein
MNAYEGTYKVVNYEWHQSLPELFDTFSEALSALNKWDQGASIEQIIGDSVDVVWQPEFALFMSNVNF